MMPGSTKFITKTKVLMISGSGFVLACLVFMFFQKDPAVEDQRVSSKPETQEQAAETVNQSEVAASVKKPHQETADAVQKENPFLGKEAKARLVQIRDTFAEDIRYPTFSQPIRDESELAKYLPNRSFASSTAIDLDDANAQPLDDTRAPKISLKTSKHLYFSGEPIVAEAEISGLDESSFSSVDARLVVGKNIIASATEVTKATDSTSQQYQRQYRLVFDDLGEIDVEHLGAMTVVASFVIDKESYEIGTPIQYANTVATLDYVGVAEVNEEYLHIPVHIKTTDPGFHRVSGNLYNAETGQPLIHLSGKHELTGEQGVIMLKAHIVSLKRMGHEGPYELRDIALIRMPSEPKYLTEQGLVEVSSFTIEGFPFSDYEDIPYVDEKAQARLDFLTQIGSTN